MVLPLRRCHEVNSLFSSFPFSNSRANLTAYCLSSGTLPTTNSSTKLTIQTQHNSPSCIQVLAPMVCTSLMSADSTLLIMKLQCGRHSGYYFSWSVWVAFQYSESMHSRYVFLFQLWLAYYLTHYQLTTAEMDAQAGLFSYVTFYDIRLFYAAQFLPTWSQCNHSSTNLYTREENEGT